MLQLGGNQIGDAGVTALAESITKGGLPKCTTLYVHGNPASNADVVKEALASRKK